MPEETHTMRPNMLAELSLGEKLPKPRRPPKEPAASGPRTFDAHDPFAATADLLRLLLTCEPIEAETERFVVAEGSGGGGYLGGGGDCSVSFEPRIADGVGSQACEWRIWLVLSNAARSAPLRTTPLRTGCIPSLHPGN